MHKIYLYTIINKIEIIANANCEAYESEDRADMLNQYTIDCLAAG